MRFMETPINSVYVVGLERRDDPRGFFARIFCSEEFAMRGLQSTFVQINNALSTLTGTLRGMHYQVAPEGDAKLVRCIAGSAYDVVLDLRAQSETFGHWFGKVLTAENREMIYVPAGCAHGYLTLGDQTEMLYLASTPHSATHERVVRWNDPKFGICWPLHPRAISEKDRTAPNYTPTSHASGY
jgi:dTDP-4-dehydrorhamnose 3,5-epimerase